jgi:hypothetical protein
MLHLHVTSHAARSMCLWAVLCSALADVVLADYDRPVLELCMRNVDRNRDQCAPAPV